MGVHIQMTPAKESRGGMHLERAVTPSSPSGILFYYPAPYPGFEGVVLGHVIQQ